MASEDIRTGDICTSMTLRNSLEVWYRPETLTTGSLFVRGGFYPNRFYRPLRLSRDNGESKGVVAIPRKGSECDLVLTADEAEQAFAVLSASGLAARPVIEVGRTEVPAYAEIAAACEAEGTPLAPVAALTRPRRTCVECGSPVYGECCTHCHEG